MDEFCIDANIPRSLVSHGSLGIEKNKPEIEGVAALRQDREGVLHFCERLPAISVPTMPPVLLSAGTRGMMRPFVPS